MTSGASFPKTARQVRCIPLLITYRMLAFAKSCDHPGKISQCKVLPPLKFCMVMPVSSETLCKAAMTSSATATSLLMSMWQHLISSHLKLHPLWAQSSFRSISLFLKSVFSVSPTYFRETRSHAPFAAMTSQGSDNPPKRDGSDFKGLKFQSASLSLQSSVPDGIQPSRTKRWS